jgi:two-component SAPR family response regulator
LRHAREPGKQGQFRWAGYGLSALFSLALEHGVETDLVRELIVRWQVRPDGAANEHWPWPIKIRALGAFDVRVDEQRLVNEGKAQFRVLELLRALLSTGEREVSTQVLAERLWPDAEGDSAYANLKMALHRLRKLLRHEGVVRVHDNKVSLDPQLCWVDVWAFERHLDELRNVHPGSEHSATDLKRIRSCIDLYRGDFLAQESVSWALARRAQLRKRLQHLVSLLEGRDAPATHASLSVELRTLARGRLNAEELR